MLASGPTGPVGGGIIGITIALELSRRFPACCGASIGLKMPGVPLTCDASREEAFGPLANLSKFSDWDEALEQVNDSRFGLQAGIFTRDIHQVLEAWDMLDVGGVVVNDVSSYRVDNMPYGGVKDSGLGREGIRFAMEDMSEIRNLIIRRL